MRGNHWLLLFSIGCFCLVMPAVAEYVRQGSPEGDIVKYVQAAGFGGTVSNQIPDQSRRVHFLNDLEKFDDDGSLALIERECKVNGHVLESGEEKDLYVQGNQCSITIGLRPGIANAISRGGSFCMRLLSNLERLFRKRSFTFICNLPDIDEVNIASSFIAACAYAESAGSGALSYWVKPTLELEVSLVLPVEM